MRWSNDHFRSVLAGLLLCCAASATHAQQRPTDDASATPTLGAPIRGDALAAMRGGEDTVTVDVGNLGKVDGNTAIDVATGDNLIGGGAFAQAAGITTVIQNSGANVLIQSGTAVNVQFVPPTP